MDLANAATKPTPLKSAFTLAEVLITLGIIGIVAAMTLPAIMQNYQKMVLKNQFKKSYANFFNAVKLAQAKNGSPVGCFYWVKKSTGCTPVCVEREPVYNDCLRSECSETGGPVPAGDEGPREDCNVLEEELFTKTLKVAKFCRNNALVNGCLTNEYRGIDKIKAEQNPDAEFPPNPNGIFSDSNIKNQYPSWILTDGTLIIKYATYKTSASPIFIIDINGHKKPNKWGYDIFTFRLLGETTAGITQLSPSTYATEKGGIRTEQMMQDMNK